MEALGDSGFGSMTAVTKRRRSDIARRPRSEPQLITEHRDLSSHPSMPYSNNSSPEENVGSDGGFRRKEYYLNNPPLRSSSGNRFEGITDLKKHKRDYKIGVEFDGYHGSGSTRVGNGSDLKRCSEGVLAPANWKSTSKVKESYEWQSTSPGDHNMHQSTGPMNLSTDTKLRKVKLKVGGVTRTIHAKSKSDMGDAGPVYAKPPRIGDASRHRQKLSPQEEHSKDSNGLRFSHITKEDTRGKFGEGSLAGNVPSSDPVRKSKRVPKRRALNSEFDDADEDDEIRYLEKLKISKVAADNYVELEDNGEDNSKKRKVSKIPRNRNAPYEMDEDFVLSRSNRENRKKSRLGKESDDTDADEEEPGSDGGPETKNVESPADVRAEPLTTRQRARQSGKSGNGESLIEFPNGLPPAPSRKHKEKLSEVEIQAKKAEIAQRRKMQVEKADREAQADVIRKVRGLDSDKKKEEKKQKELEEREKAAKSQELAASSIRWVIGQTGTIVTFGEDIGIPSLLTSNPCSYPPPREKCAGPLCTNQYKYRDSKSKLPLCSLQCYRAVQGSAHSLTSF
ncbi:uncharacterized protein [Typha latifolia]|uniref:uncharacterized protein n=1 Tax=Typha latifolia TaxID=4733 RepID=UPI003C30965C